MATKTKKKEVANVPSVNGLKRYTFCMNEKSMKAFKKSAKSQGLAYQTMIRDVIDRAAAKL